MTGTVTRRSRRTNGDGGEKERKSGAALYISAMSSAYAPHSRGHGQHKRSCSSGPGNKRHGHYSKGMNSSLPPRTAKESNLAQDECLDPLDMLDCGSQPLATPLSKDERKICELMADVLCARSALDTRKLFSVLAQKVEGQRLQLSYGGTGCSSSRKAGGDGRFGSLSSEPDEDSSRRSHDKYLAELRARLSAQQERYQNEREAQRQEGLRNAGGKGKQQANPNSHSGPSLRGEKNKRTVTKVDEEKGKEKKSSKPIAGETCGGKPTSSPKDSSIVVEDEQVLELGYSPVKTPIANGNPRNLSSTKEIRSSLIASSSTKKSSLAETVNSVVNEEKSKTTGEKTAPPPMELSYTSQSHSSVSALNEANKKHEKTDLSSSQSDDEKQHKSDENVLNNSVSEDEKDSKNSSFVNKEDKRENRSPTPTSSKHSSDEKEEEDYGNEDFEDAPSNAEVSPDRSSDKTEEKEKEEEEEKLPWE